MNNIFLLAKRELGYYLNTIWGYAILAIILVIDGILFNTFAMGANTERYSTDVLQNEQFIDRNYYKKMNKNSNILISKHLGGLTKESIYKTDKEIFKNFLKYYEQN